MPDPIPKSTFTSTPQASGPEKARLRILLPIALTSAALAFFLVAFWPNSHKGKRVHGHRRSASVQRGSPAGGADRGNSGDLGNASVTEKPEDWWRPEKGNSSRNQGDEWWYQDKRSAGKDAASGYKRVRKADEKSGPDNNWWHD